MKFATLVAGVALLSGCAVPAPAPPQVVNSIVASPRELQKMLHEALSRNDYHGAAQYLQALAERSAYSLQDVGDSDVLAVVHGVPADRAGEARRAVLEALFRADWKPSNGVEPSALWLELTYMRAASQDLTGARAATTRITDPMVRILRYADRRSEALVERKVAADEVARDARAQVEQLRAATVRHPRSLHAVVLLVHALRVDQRYTEALTTALPALEAVDDAVQRQAAIPYDDDDQLRWLIDAEADALWNLGQFEEATRVMDAARQLPESGGPNISQRLNLAEMYCSLGKPAKALALVHDMENDRWRPSAYGMMVLQSIRLDAALQSADKSGAAAGLEYLRQHEDDDPSTVIDGLIYVGDLAAADALMRKVLANPNQRGDLLLSLQDYADSARPPLEQQWLTRWQQWSRRPEVQVEVAKWGHVDRYPVMRAL